MKEVFSELVKIKGYEMKPFYSVAEVKDITGWDKSYIHQMAGDEFGYIKRKNKNGKGKNQKLWLNARDIAIFLEDAYYA
jgi:hypothetical protein